jgi:predicted transcriptional regulator
MKQEKQTRKKSPKISEAIFRGKKSLYSFEVFPLAAEIEETSAIYVITKRKTDKSGKAHHAFRLHRANRFDHSAS